jgi:hypothetical protein
MYDRTLQAISAVDCNSSLFDSSILTENVVGGDGHFRMFGCPPNQDSDMARTLRLAECAQAVSKTILGRRLLMLTCIQK